MSNTSTTPPKGSGILLEAGTNDVEFLEFGLGSERYGVNVSKVSQIVKWSTLTLTELPAQQPWFLGTTSFRNVSIPVLDLRQLLHVPATLETNPNRLLLALEFNRRVTGFLVDSVYAIQRVSWKQFVPMSEAGFAKNDSCVTGSIAFEDRLVLIVDFEAMMSEIDPSQGIDSFKANVSADTTIDRTEIRILYCEDSPVIQRVMLEILTAAGFSNVTVHTTGAQGLQELTKNPRGFDVVISDIEMPEMDGLALCKNIKTSTELKHLPVIFFSSLANDQMRAKCASVQGDACFAKPEAHLVTKTIDLLYRKALEGLATTPAKAG